MQQVVEINAIEDLEAIRLRWTALLYETPEASFFHTLDWLKVYWRHFRDSQRVRVLLVHRGGTVLGILPLVVREGVTAANPHEVLTYPTINPSQFYGPLGSNPTATLMASCRHLARTSRDCDSLLLASIGEHDHGRTANAMQLAGFCPHEDVRATIAKVCFDASRPAYLSELEAEVAERLDYLDRESEVAGEIVFERIRPLGSTFGDVTPVEELVEECFRLNQGVHSTNLATGTSVALFRDVATAASRLGMLDLNLLRLDGRMIAFSFNVHFDGAIQQLCVGESAESCTFQPASMLMLRMLQDSFLRKDRYIYITESNGDFVSSWPTQRLPVVSYQQRLSMPYRTRLARIGQWLTLPLARI
ncbi:MAG: GNAT family N-acetyltransferase [Planctomycetota bacterium]|nr:GNAT family N-acetyltransferase [Planctomycetota bacterium]